MKPSGLGLFWALVGVSGVLTASGLLWAKSQIPDQFEVAALILLLPPAAVYLAGISIFLFVLGGHQVSLSFPVATAVSMILTVLGGVFLLNETVSLFTLIGLSMILVGLVFVGYSQPPRRITSAS